MIIVSFRSSIVGEEKAKKIVMAEKQSLEVKMLLKNK